MDKRKFVICAVILLGTFFTSCTPDDDFDVTAPTPILVGEGGDSQPQPDPCKGNCDD